MSRALGAHAGAHSTNLALTAAESGAATRIHVPPGHQAMTEGPRDRLPVSSSLPARGLPAAPAATPRVAASADTSGGARRPLLLSASSHFLFLSSTSFRLLAAAADEANRLSRPGGGMLQPVGLSWHEHAAAAGRKCCGIHKTFACRSSLWAPGIGRLHFLAIRSSRPSNRRRSGLASDCPVCAIPSGL
jgi:hypothetical protein